MRPTIRVLSLRKRSTSLLNYCFIFSETHVLTKVKLDSMQASRVALCTSGTVALELQLARLPCVVAYRAHLLTEWFIRYKAKISYISLPNILLDSSIIPEALFAACTPSKLASLLM